MGRKYGTALSQVGLELKKFQKQKLKNGQNLRNNYKLFKLTQYILLNKNITFCSYLDFCTPLLRQKNQIRTKKHEIDLQNHRVQS